jgi:hypothetical protein
MHGVNRRQEIGKRVEGMVLLLKERVRNASHFTRLPEKNKFKLGKRGIRSEYQYHAQIVL